MQFLAIGFFQSSITEIATINNFLVAAVLADRAFSRQPKNEKFIQQFR